MSLSDDTNVTTQSVGPRELQVILRDIAADPTKHSMRTIGHWCDIAAKELDDLITEVKQLRSCKRQLIDHQIILAELTMRLDTLKQQGRINTVPVTELYKAAGEFSKVCSAARAGTEHGFHTIDTSALEMRLMGAAMQNQWPADLRPCDARVPATGGMSGDQHESPMDEALKEFNESVAQPKTTEQRRVCQMCGLMIHRNSTVPVCGSCYPRYQVIQSMPKPVTEVS